MKKIIYLAHNGLGGITPESCWLISIFCVLFICSHNHLLTTFMACFLEFGLADSIWSFDQIDTSPPWSGLFFCAIEAHRTRMILITYIRLVTECICHHLYWQKEYHLAHGRHEDKFEHWSSLDIDYYQKYRPCWAIHTISTFKADVGGSLWAFNWHHLHSESQAT